MSPYVYDKVVKHIKDVGRTSANNASKETGLSVSTCQRALKVMHERMLVSLEVRQYRTGILAKSYTWLGIEEGYG